MNDHAPEPKVAPRVPQATRREFLGAAAAAGVATLSGPTVFAQGQAAPLALPDLPYADTALAPHVSQQTLQIHWGKHHRAYVDKANGLLKGSDLAGRPLEEIVRAAAAKGDQALFNNAAQAWNHAFYWKGMSPKGGGRPTGGLKDRIDADFGSIEKLKEALAAAATGQFGSGWAWLVLEGGQLKVTKTANAETPLTVAGQKPLLTIDVWEHAYYLDYQNRRADYVTAFLDKLLNWDFAAENLAAK